MRDVLAQLDAWRSEHRRAAIATVVGVSGSSPRPAGARMIVADNGAFSGSVSAGCVEADVFDDASKVIESGQPRIHHFGISDELGLQVGLSCGGEIDVWVEPDWLAEPTERSVADALRRALDEEAPVCLITTVDQVTPRHLLVHGDGSRTGTSGDARVDARATADALQMLDQGLAQSIQYETPAGPLRLFFDAYSAPPTLLIFGGTQVAIPLVTFAKRTGFRVIVADGRPRFAIPERFPEADRVLLAWPEAAAQQVRIDRSTFVAVLNHDPKFDEPALKAALGRGARYVGAIGSRRTRAQQQERLREQGVPEADLARVRGPIGLDIGARTPEETAIAILAEVIAERYGRPGGKLSARLLS